MERVVQVARETGYLDGVQDFRGDRRLRPSAAEQGGGALHRQPGRAARGARRASPRTSIREVTLSRGDRVIFSSRTIPGNEKAVGARHQRADRPGHRGHHRPHPSGPRLRPSAPRRARGTDRLGQAADRHPGARRGAASVRARRARAPLGVKEIVLCRNGDLVRLAPGAPASSTRCRRGGSTRTARCWSRQTRAPSPTANG